MSADPSSTVVPSSPRQSPSVAPPSTNPVDAPANTESKASVATVDSPSSTRDRLHAWVKNVAQDSQTQVEEFLEQIDARQSGE